MTPAGDGDSSPDELQVTASPGVGANIVVTVTGTSSLKVCTVLIHMQGLCFLPWLLRWKIRVNLAPQINSSFRCVLCEMAVNHSQQVRGHLQGKHRKWNTCSSGYIN